MKVAVKYLILVMGFIAGLYSVKDGTIGAGFTAAGAFIAFALIEIQDLKILNKEEKDDRP
ncbi:MAG: hypothetical protein ABI581_10505 [Sediminibacterium sp.]